MLGRWCRIQPFLSRNGNARKRLGFSEGLCLFESGDAIGTLSMSADLDQKQNSTSERIEGTARSAVGVLRFTDGLGPGCESPRHRRLRGGFRTDWDVSDDGLSVQGDMYSGNEVGRDQKPRLALPNAPSPATTLLPISMTIWRWANATIGNSAVKNSSELSI